MRYAGLIENDLTGGPGLSVTFFVQGCPHKCQGCFNQKTWDYEGGQELPNDFLEDIVKKLHANNINRRLCIMGGEPLCQENLFLTLLILKTVKEKSPDTELAVWTGYQYENLLKSHNAHLTQILELIDILVDGPFILEQKDTSLVMRGSRNQRIIDIKNSLKNNEIILKTEYYEKVEK